MNTTIMLFLLQDGITNGAIYALLGLALVLVFAVTRVMAERRSHDPMTWRQHVVSCFEPVTWLGMLYGVARVRDFLAS